MVDNKKDDDRSSSSKTSSFYTLSSNDNPGNLITQVQFKGDNYEEWAWAIRIALRAKKKIGFVDASITKPADDAQDLEDWWAQRFSMGNGPRVQQLRTDLANCKLNGEAIVTYYGKLKMLWEELSNYEQVPVCNCTGCKCDLFGKMERKAEEDKVHQFLMGLDEEGYGTLRSNILSTNPLPNLNKVYAMTVQEERVKTVMKTKEEKSNPMSFAIQAGNRNMGKDKSKTTCSNCKRDGHVAENCFQLIGYP
ncbi:retrovirus-related Pol polyprotein from transposon TNT 1-94 [Senna tora]|uniref:Retrovirus-related Pol polyprotein from transposon TNT 1-94 n=1 Tax=Senna tora TaxID=362788 RepID=A0A834T4V4_9FABA|nr:retrovirus-related Pol polyprotein from transposon TNT 1-94 [Senna tora]